MRFTAIFCLFLFLLFHQTVESKRSLRKRSKRHDLDRFTIKWLQVNSRWFNWEKFETILNHFLVPRHVGSSGHRKVQNYIRTSLEKLGPNWNVQVDRFSRKTAQGRVKFSNLIGTFIPDKCTNGTSLNRTILACHYDSLHPSLVAGSGGGGLFVAATDAAVSCAMMLYVARSLSSRLKSTRRTLELVFFDGEEPLPGSGLEKANSLYGSRHLAKRWATFPPDYCADHRSVLDNEIEARPTPPGNLTNIELFLLLDLIGGASSRFFNTNLATARYFHRLVTIEQTLLDWESRQQPRQSHRSRALFHSTPAFVFSLVRDDHLPFMARGVPILHLIPNPFPRNWHQMNDNRANVNMDIVERVTIVLEIFLRHHFDHRHHHHHHHHRLTGH